MLSPRSQQINRNKKNRRKFSFLRFLFFLIVIAFVFVVFYSLFFSPFLKITSIELSGNKYIENNLILDKINSEISGKFFNIIEKNNLLLVKAGKIKKDIQAEFKIIREIEIKRKFPTELIVSIVEREPQLVFCSTEGCFVVDENGEAYDSYVINQEKDKNNFIILTEESSRKINLGEIILEKKYMNYVLKIRQELFEWLAVEVDNNFRVTSLISGDIRVKTKEGWEIYFNENINLEKEIEMLKVVLENKIEKNQRQDLEYIDLRIDNKIYYKFREGTPSQILKIANEAPQDNTEEKTTTDKEDEDKKKKD